jgi:predicted Zn-dependent peptidase
VNGEAESGELYVGFQVPSMQFEQSTELQILANLLGGSSASRLFKGISERQGLVYGISCGYDGLYGQGSFQIATSARPENMDAIMDGVFREMSTLRNELVPQRELDVLVRNGRYAMGKGFETNEGREQIIEGRLFYGWDSVAKMGRWGSVTPQDILELSREHLPASREDGNYVVLAKTPK